LVQAFLKYPSTKQWHLDILCHCFVDAYWVEIKCLDIMSLFCWCIKSGSKMPWHTMSLCHCFVDAYWVEIKCLSNIYIKNILNLHCVFYLFDIYCMSRNFISTLYASTKQRQYVNAFYFHSVCNASLKYFLYKYLQQF
jgi:hypothetical protein